MTVPYWIAFTTRVTTPSEYDEPRDCIARAWSTWATARRALPAILPNNGELAVEMLRRLRPALMILTGGNDAKAMQQSAGSFDAVRNETEFMLLDEAVQSKTPVLGVCRGMHMINLYFGGRVMEMLPATAARHVACTHTLRLAPPLSTLIGDERATTNSFHNQGFFDADIATSLGAAAWCAEDGLVEAVVHRTLPIIGIGWHPERANPAAALDEALVAALIDPTTSLSETRP